VIKLRLDRVLVITKKDWEEIYESRLTLFSVIFPYMIPLGLFLLINLISKIFGVEFYRYISLEELEGVIGAYPIISDMDPPQLFYYIICVLVIPTLFMIFSLASISILTADSFAGEKERKTIEALFASPISDSELFLGKLLASFIPSIILTYLFYIVAIVIINLATADIFGSLWYPTIEAGLAVFVITPLYAFLGMTLVIWGSSRASNVRDASNYAGILIIPALIFILSIMTGIIVFSIYYIIIIAIILTLIDIVTFYLCYKTFNRERLITSI